MQFLGRLASTWNQVTNIFTNPFRVKEVPLSEYAGCLHEAEDGKVLLFHHGKAGSWDALLIPSQNSKNAIRLFQIKEEWEAREHFAHFAEVLHPFYESCHQDLRVETLQKISDCLRNHPHWSAAHIAVETGVRDCLRHNYILSCINSTESEHGCTPLHLACRKDDINIVHDLIDCHVHLDVTDNNGETAFHYAAAHNNAHIIEVLGHASSTAVNHLSHFGETPLHVACRLGNADVTHSLLLCHARCDIMGSHGYPIHTAMKFGQKDCVEAILEANPSQLHAEDRDYNGTPLHWAKHAAIARMLIDHGANVNSVSKTGETPLHIMVKRERFGCILVLLTHGADTNTQGENGNTPLHLAMKMDQIEVIKALIVFGADVEIPNNLGETPGLIAARSSRGKGGVLTGRVTQIQIRPSRTSPAVESAVLGWVFFLLLESDDAVAPPHTHTLCTILGFDDLLYVATTLGTLTKMRDQVDCATDASRRYDRLLCLDGGGIKGLVLIQMLIAIEKIAGRPIRELFDWVSGTSTGGILALAVVHGKPMLYLRCLYFRMKDEVFKGSRPYDSAPLEEFLKKEFGETTKMIDIRRPKVIVTGTVADRHPAELHLFRNYAAPETGNTPSYEHSATTEFRPFTMPEEQLVWRAARSSGAAPSYFRPMGRFLDGGLLANNPTLDAMTEIHEYNKSLKLKGRGAEVRKLGVVVSLGTGKPCQVPVTSVDVFRPSNPLELAKTVFGARELGKMVVDCCTDSDGPAVSRARAWCEMVDTLFFRFSPQLDSEVALDEIEDGVLIHMLWETQMHIFQHRDEFQHLVECLLDV
ncbi:85/88 kDa calcium-independent phospholipase A2 [Latimeria chalumnae]|uniref:85/88 kDa calcium-independent phospholipase A2 n=1 Tax=Latimeria chalumnae TaxID=7897 RepID=UPI00313DD7BC